MPTDIPMIFEQLTAIRLLDEAHTVALRRRYRDVLMDGFRSNPGAEALSALPQAAKNLGNAG